MKTLALLFVFFFCAMYMNCANGQNLTSKMKIELQVDSTFLSMVKSAENLDYDQISKGVDDRYHAGFIINNGYYLKYDSLINTLKSRLPAGAKQSIQIGEKKITVLSDSIVLLTSTGIADVSLNNGQSFRMNFFWSFVYEKIDNTWKVIQSHQSGKQI